MSVTEGTGSDEGGFEGMGEGGIESVRLDDEIQWAKEDYDRQDEWERERQRDEFAMKMAGHMPDGHLVSIGLCTGFFCTWYSSHKLLYVSRICLSPHSTTTILLGRALA